MAWFAAIACATFWISGESFRIWEWQFMQVEADGIPATLDLSAAEWQYRQAIWLSPA
jgi:hypothetical protein